MLIAEIDKISGDFLEKTIRCRRFILAFSGYGFKECPFQKYLEQIEETFSNNSMAQVALRLDRPCALMTATFCLYL